MQIALALCMFVLAADGLIGAKILHMPLVACTIIGALLNDVQTGITIGASVQLYYLISGTDDSTSAIFSCAAVILVSEGSVTAENIMLGTLSFTIAMAVDSVLKIVSALFVPMARNAADKLDMKKMAAANFMPMIIRGLAGAVIGYLAYGHASDLYTILSSIETNGVWILNFVTVLSFMLKFVGLAVVLRNLTLKDMYGALLAGFATAVICGVSSTYTLAVCGMIAFAVAAYDFKNNSSASGSTDTVNKKGGAEKWW